MFNPQEHLTKLKGKDYLEVKWRLAWFRDAYPHGVIETKMLTLDLDRGLAVFQAVVYDGEGGQATSHGSETAKDFPDFVEKAETKAIGRALAALGFGTQFTGEDLDEGARIVDSPVRRGEAAPRTRVPQPQGNGNGTPRLRQVSASELPMPLTPEQQQSIKNLCVRLKRPLPDTSDLSYQQGRDLIASLVADWRKVKPEGAKAVQSSEGDPS